MSNSENISSLLICLYLLLLPFRIFYSPSRAFLKCRFSHFKTFFKMYNCFVSFPSFFLTFLLKILLTCLYISVYPLLTSLVAQWIKHLSAMWETRVPSPGRKFPWRRKRQPTPVLLPGKSHGRSSLVGLQSTGLQRLTHGWAASLLYWIIWGVLNT